MAEWLKAHAWKACIPQGIQGSNPCLSASFLPLLWTGGVMPVKLAAVEKVVLHHALNQQKSHYGQANNH
jgi:hypothetical protein